MVQIITPTRTKPKSFAQSVMGGFAEGLPGAIEKYQGQKLAQQNMQQENEAAKKMGIDLSGLHTPKMREQVMTESLKGKNKRDLQAEKFQQQMQLINESGLGDNESTQQGQISTGQQQQEGNTNVSLDEQETLEANQPKTPKLISPKKIATMAAINPAIADKMQKHNDNLLAMQRHNENMQQKQTTAKRSEVSSSYKEAEPYINKTYDQYEDSLRREAILDRMDQLNESGELSDSGTINMLESLGLDPEWLKNPSNSEYSKLSLDLLGGGTLQADYGSRVLQSEFAVAQKRVPTLSQTPEGRKQISENIKTMLLPARLKNERMQYYLDQAERTGKPLPHNLRGKILQDIKSQLEEAYDKFKQRNGRYQVKQGTEPDDNAMEKYYHIFDGNVDKAMKAMEEDGYDVEQ